MIHNYDQEQIASADVFRSIVVQSILSFDFHTLVDDFLGGFWGISRGLTIGIFFVGFMLILNRLIPDFPLFAFQWIFGTLPLWFPPVAIFGGWSAWTWYTRAHYLASQKSILLEVKFPRDIVKSPRAMEAVLAQMWTDSGETTFFNRVYQGQCRPYFSFEIASFGGDVHFYVWTRAGWKTIIEAAFYAQYPNVELVEVEDYASKFHYDPDEHEVFCTDWRYEPRNDAYQLRTYVEFELDKDPKEEYKVDPLAQPLELLSSLQPGEQMWIQFVITMNRDTRRKPRGRWFETESRWVGLLDNEINEIRKKSLGDPNAPGEEWRRYSRMPQHRQRLQIEAIDRNMGKLPFNVGSRGVYIASPELFHASKYTGIRWIWRPIANPQWGNQMRPRRWHNPFDYPWQDLWDMRWYSQARRFFDCYRRRSHFYTPWILPHNMMSTEPLATMWHPPSTAITAPGLERIPARKAEPPPNLPR